MQYYTDLTDMDARNAAGVTPIKPYVDKILAIKNLDDLTAYLSDSGNVLTNKFMTVSIAADSADSTKYAVNLAPSALSLKDAAEYSSITQNGTTQKTASEALFTKSLEKFGISESEAKKRFSTVIDLETKLATAEFTTVETKSASYFKASYNPETMAELKKIAAAYPIEGVLKPYTDGGATNYVLTQPKWLAKLGELYTADNVEAWKDMLLYGLAMTVVSNSVLDQDFIDIYNEYSSTIMGSPVAEDAAGLAYKQVADTTDSLKWATGKIFAENSSSEKAKSDLTDLVKKALAVYRKRLQSNTWLSDTTKAKAIEKLDAMRIRVGYPDDWTPYEITGLNLKSKDEGGNALKDLEAVLKYQLGKDIEKASKPVDKDAWPLSPQMTQAGYMPDDNSINFPAGKLGGGYFDENKSEAANMGSIGCIIGHEMTHAFDSMGSQYDKDGNLKNWWTDADSAAFKERASKVSAYFSTFEPIAGVKENGDMSIGESVADLGGVSCMLELAKSIDNFDFKTFFESFGHKWKEQMPAALAESIVRSDEHPLGYMRINATLQQFTEFYDTYGVKEGDNMYVAPADRLSVW